MQALFEKYDLNYHTAPDVQAGRSAPGTRWSGCRCPTAGWPTTKPSNAPKQLAMLYKMTTGGPKVRRAAQARLNQQARKAA